MINNLGLRFDGFLWDLRLFPLSLEPNICLNYQSNSQWRQNWSGNGYTWACINISCTDLGWGGWVCLHIWPLTGQGSAVSPQSCFLKELSGGVNTWETDIWFETLLYADNLQAATANLNWRQEKWSKVLLRHNTHRLLWSQRGQCSLVSLSRTPLVLQERNPEVSASEAGGLGGLALWEVFVRGALLVSCICKETDFWAEAREMCLKPVTVIPGMTCCGGESATARERQLLVRAGAKWPVWDLTGQYNAAAGDWKCTFCVGGDKDLTSLICHCIKLAQHKFVNPIRTSIPGKSVPSEAHPCKHLPALAWVNFVFAAVLLSKHEVTFVPLTAMLTCCV